LPCRPKIFLLTGIKVPVPVLPVVIIIIHCAMCRNKKNWLYWLGL
jgi:hypothetical protein